MKKITKDLVINIHKKVEKIGKRKFLQWDRSWYYSFFAKSGLKKIGLLKSEIDHFIKTTAMTTKKHFMIPYEIGSREGISLYDQVEIAFHELQHSIDNVDYIRYLTDDVYRAYIEYRGYSVSDQVKYLLGRTIGHLEISSIYKLGKQANNVFLIGRKSTRKNIENGPSFEASKLAYKLLK